MSTGGVIALPNRDLSYLTEGTAEFDAYIEALRWAQTFALLNRDEMMERVADCVSTFMGSQVRRLESVGCHHNDTERETHFGTEVWLSRKGPFSAELGRPGLIPGSMGTGPTSSSARATRMRCVRLRTAPAGLTRGRRRRRCSPGTT